jgi:type IV pilus assembly protein PilE
MKNPLSMNDKGYSLTEVLVAIIIIGILIMLAVPVYRSLTTRAKQTEAKTQLAALHTMQIAYHMEFDRYGGSLKDIGFEQVPLITEEGTARYKIAIDSAGSASYVATATAVVDFDGDGIMDVWKIDHKGKVTQRVED